MNFECFCAAMAAQKHSIKTNPPQDWGGMGGVDNLMANRNQSDQDTKGTGIYKLKPIGNKSPCPGYHDLPHAKKHRPKDIISFKSGHGVVQIAEFFDPSPCPYWRGEDFVGISNLLRKVVGNGQDRSLLCPVVIRVGELPRIELGIQRSVVEQLGMRALFDNFSMIQHVNPVGVADGAQAVSDDDSCASVQ